MNKLKKLDSEIYNDQVKFIDARNSLKQEMERNLQSKRVITPIETDLYFNEKSNFTLDQIERILHRKEDMLSIYDGYERKLDDLYIQLQNTEHKKASVLRRSDKL